MILENEPLLQRWLANQLKSISDADPVALASYAIALLKHHDKKGDVLKNHCEEQLFDFLKENTTSFMESLFRVLNDGSYKLGNADDDDDDESGRFRSHSRGDHDDDFDEDDDSCRRRERNRRRDNDGYDDYEDSQKRPRHESSPSNVPAISPSPIISTRTGSRAAPAGSGSAAPGSTYRPYANSHDDMPTASNGGNITKASDVNQQQTSDKILNNRREHQILGTDQTQSKGFGQYQQSRQSNQQSNQSSQYLHQQQPQLKYQQQQQQQQQQQLKLQQQVQLKQQQQQQLQQLQQQQSQQQEQQQQKEQQQQQHQQQQQLSQRLSQQQQQQQQSQQQHHHQQQQQQQHHQQQHQLQQQNEQIHQQLQQQQQKQQQQQVIQPVVTGPTRVILGRQQGQDMGGVFDGMGPETQRAIFGAMGSSMLGVLAPSVPQPNPGPSSYVGNVPVQLDYNHLGALGLDIQYPPLGMVEGMGIGMGIAAYPSTFNIMGPPFSHGFPTSQMAPNLGRGEIDTNREMVGENYDLLRPLPPPIDYSILQQHMKQKPAPPSAPPPLPILQLQHQGQGQGQGGHTQIQPPLQPPPQHHQQHQALQLPYEPPFQHHLGTRDQQQHQQWGQDKGDTRTSHYGQGQGQGHGRQSSRQTKLSHDQYRTQNFLSEHEKCTLKCTGLPLKVTEADLRNHFKAFGRVVELQLIETDSVAGSEKKSYNECLVQMGTAQDAKKCLNSPSAVLNNRFVKVMYSTFNIVDLADIRPLAAEGGYSNSSSSASLGSGSVGHINSNNNGGSGISSSGGYGDNVSSSSGSNSNSNSNIFSKENILPSAINAVRKTKKWVNEEIPLAPESQDRAEQLLLRLGIEREKEKEREKERRISGVGLHGRGYGVSNKFVASHTRGVVEQIVSDVVPISCATGVQEVGDDCDDAEQGIGKGGGDGDGDGDEDPMYVGLDLNKFEPDPDSVSYSNDDSSSNTPRIVASNSGSVTVTIRGDSNTAPPPTLTSTSTSRAVGTPTVVAIPVAPASVPLTKEDIALQQQYEGLRALRQQADSIWKKKESLLQGQMDQYRIMIAKLETSTDNLAKADLLENIEGKILDLQSQLRSVRDQRETGVVPQQVVPPVYGGRGGRGRGRGQGQGQSMGYHPYNAGRGEYTGRGREYLEDEDSGGRGRGRGRGRFGGRGAIAAASAGRSRVGFTTIDNRTKSLVVVQPPEGFTSSAQEHFKRFGEVADVATLADGSITVRFKERRDAESAKTRGAFYNSGVLLMDWLEAEENVKKSEMKRKLNPLPSLPSIISQTQTHAMEVGIISAIHLENLDPQFDRIMNH